MKQIIIIREVLNKNKSVKFHTREGGGLDKFGSFSHFFLLALFHANMQRKVYFVGEGGTTSPERSWIFQCYIIQFLWVCKRGNFFFFVSSCLKFFIGFTLFRGRVWIKSVKFHTYFFSLSIENFPYSIQELHLHSIIFCSLV